MPRTNKPPNENTNQSPVPAQTIERRILVLRGRKVLLDFDLAKLYGVATKRLNEQVKRNKERFPADFMFRLNRAEVEALNRSQFATGSQKHRDPRYPPFAFTEHGAAFDSAQAAQEAGTAGRWRQNHNQ